MRQSWRYRPVRLLKLSVVLNMERLGTHRIATILAITMGIGACAQSAVKLAESDSAQTDTPTHSIDLDLLRAAVGEFKLSNGMTVLMRENRVAPVVTWMVFYRIGSSHEGPGTMGGAHLLEHMLFKGSNRFQNGQISQLLRRNGAHFSATTSRDYTTYYETYSSDRIELGLMIEADRMRQALILDAERQEEMRVIRDELARGQNDPEDNIRDAIRASAFEAHPYHHPIMGYRSDVEGISTKRLRQLYDAHYHPNNAIAVLVGDFKTDRALNLIKQYFEPIPPGPKPTANYTDEPPQMGERRVTLKRWGEANVVAMAFHIPAATSTETAKLALMEAVLTHGPRSRLKKVLVDGGLAIRVSADAEQLKDPGLFWVTVVLRPGVTHTAVEKLLEAEFENLRTTPVGAEELRAAKNQAEAAYAFRADGTAGTAWALGHWSIIDRWSRFYGLLDELRTVTPKDLQEVASRTLLADNRSVGWYVASRDFPRRPNSEPVGAKAKTVPKQIPARLPTQGWESRPTDIKAVPGLRVSKLENGLTVAVIKNDALPIVSINGFVEVGSIYDKAEAGGRYGLADLVLGMLDKGTLKRSKARLARDLTSNGASLQFSPTPELAVIKGQALSRDWAKLLEALVETLATPTFPEAELALQRDLQSAALKQNEEHASNRATRLLWQKLFPEGHPFHVAATETAIADTLAISTADLKAFHRRFYGPNASTLVVVGDIDPDAVVQRVTELTASWSRIEKIDPTRLEGWKIPPLRLTQPHVETMADQPLVEIRYGLVGTLRRRDREYYATQIANHILGGSVLTGRLGVRIRDDHGMSYGARSTLNLGRFPAPWFALVSVNRQRVPTAYWALRDVVESFIKEGPQEDEVVDARSALVGSQAVSLANNIGIASSLAAGLYYNLDPATFWSAASRQLAAVTVETARAAAIKHLSGKDTATVIAGPFDERTGELAERPSGTTDHDSGSIEGDLGPRQAPGPQLNRLWW